MQTRIIFFTILILTACTPRLIPKPDPTQAALTSSPSSEIQSTPTPTQGDILNMTPIYPPSAAPSLQSLIEKAKDDLAQRLSISVTQINILEAREVTWSDSSIGCPQEGMAYVQVLTPGYLIVLEYTNTPYEYHAGKSSDIFYCENPLPPVEGSPGNT